MLSRHLSQESSLADRKKIQGQTRNDPEADKIFHMCVCVHACVHIYVYWCVLVLVEARNTSLDQSALYYILFF